MSNPIPDQPGNTPKPGEFDELEQALRQLLEQKTPASTQPAALCNKQLAIVSQLNVLARAKPINEALIIQLASAIIDDQGSKQDVVARTHLVLGRVYLANTSMVTYPGLALAQLEQAWHYARHLPPAVYDIVLVVEAGTQLALARTRMRQADSALTLMREVRAIIHNAPESTHDVVGAHIEDLYHDTLKELYELNGLS